MADFWSFYLCFSIFYSILARFMSKILKQGRGGLGRRGGDPDLSNA